MRRPVSALAATLLALVMLLHFKTVPLAGRPRVVLVRPFAGTPVARAGPVVVAAAGPERRSLTAGPATATTAHSAAEKRAPGKGPVVAPPPPKPAAPTSTPSTAAVSSFADATGPSTIATPAPTTSVAAVPSTTVPTGIRVITGPVVSIPTGPVQVQLTLNGTQITDVTTLQMPEAFVLSHALSALAAPILRAEALIAQNAVIDTVSGATLTSKAYAASLQAALDQARH